MMHIPSYFHINYKFPDKFIHVPLRDVNKDLTPKDQDKDKDLTSKDQDLLDLTPQGQGQGPDPQGPGQDKDLNYVLKESLRTRTRTRTTARQIILIAHINLSNVQWVNVPKFHSPDIIFINVSYPYFLSSYFFLIYLTLDLSPSRAGQHIGQCISSNHPCPPLRRRHHPTSVPLFSGPRGWSPANSSSVFLFFFFAPESSSTLVWLFYSCSFWPHDPAT